jgi:lysozyme
MPAAAKAEQTLSAAGLRFIAGFEGFSPRLYNDPGGHCTIGYGHLVHRGRCNGNEPEDFKREITREQGLDLLRRDTKVAERAVNQQVQVVLTQYQFDALVSFVFNVGAGAFGGSTLLLRLNQGEYKAVPAELMRWVNSGGRPLPGLVRRRRAEGVLFSKEPTAWSMRLPTPISRSRHTPLSMRLPTPIFRKSKETTREPTRLRSPPPITRDPSCGGPQVTTCTMTTRSPSNLIGICGYRPLTLPSAATEPDVVAVTSYRKPLPRSR